MGLAGKDESLMGYMHLCRDIEIICDVWRNRHEQFPANRVKLTCGRGDTTRAVLETFEIPIKTPIRSLTTSLRVVGGIVKIACHSPYGGIAKWGDKVGQGIWGEPAICIAKHQNIASSHGQRLIECRVFTLSRQCQ